jgi:hypothetical protein
MPEPGADDVSVPFGGVLTFERFVAVQKARGACYGCACLPAKPA